MGTGLEVEDDDETAMVIIQLLSAQFYVWLLKLATKTNIAPT